MKTPSRMSEPKFTLWHQLLLIAFLFSTFKIWVDGRSPTLVYWCTIISLFGSMWATLSREQYEKLNHTPPNDQSK